MNNQTPLYPSLNGRIANEDHIRNNSKSAPDFMRKVPLANIRPAFTSRIKPNGLSEELWERELQIPMLAELIFHNNGPADPLLGDIAIDGLFYLNNGERRYRALKYLQATNRFIYPNGRPIDDVLVILNPPGTTDFDRRVKVITTENTLPFTPMQRANFYLTFKTIDGKTHDEIASIFHVSRQTIDNYILATSLPEDVQEKINLGEIKIHNALSEARKAKKNKKLGLIDPEAMEILDEATAEYQERKKREEKENLHDGDDEEFMQQDGDDEEFMRQDNSVKGTSSKGGPGADNSQAHTIPTDSIYMREQELAVWKQFVNRYEVQKKAILEYIAQAPSVVELTGGDIIGYVNEKLIERLRNEYKLTAK